jgi:phosphonopyruvate decarboxylase
MVPQGGMLPGEALRAMEEQRREDEIVITSMGSAREWMSLATARGEPLHPLDLVLVPSSMGQATSFALGLAMARPDLRVTVCSGDGSLLMNLGSLVSITAVFPSNLALLVFNNGVYEVTGAQPTPASAQWRADEEFIDYQALARATGFRSIHKFSEISEWRAASRRVLDGRGPVFVELLVSPVVGGRAPHAPRDGSAGMRAQRLMQSIAAVPVRPRFSLRRAVASDAADIEQLISHYVESGSLLPRSESFIVENLPDFIVAVEEDKIVGCAHLEDYAPSLAELRSLAVHPDRQGAGIGRGVAAAVEDLARRRQYRTLFAVSNDEAFFLRLGFASRDIPELDKERSAVSRFKGIYAKTLI